MIGLWLGTSWSIFPPYKSGDKPASPLVLAQAEVELPGGSRLRIATDATWRTHPSPNTLLGVWDFMHFGGELYDAKLELPNWCEAGPGRCGLEAGQGVLAAADAFGGNGRAQPAGRRSTRWPSKQRPGGEYRVDMGVNFAGFVEIDLRGTPGKRIDMQFSERADQRDDAPAPQRLRPGPFRQGHVPQPLQLQRGPLDHDPGPRRMPRPGGHPRVAGPHRLPQRPADFECSNQAAQ